MWEVKISRAANKKIKKLPIQVKRALTVWINVARIEGPNGIKSTKGFNDEALTVVWKGYRSSRLNRQYRVIYQAHKDIVTIAVIDVTAHDYRKK
jgi:addiction module RelE/StbE family toxin